MRKRPLATLILITMQKPAVGDLVALACSQYKERPQIAQILSMSEKKVKVRWYNGTWTRKWSVYLYKERENNMPWDEEVELEDIIYTNVKLTPSGALTVETKRELKKLY